MLWLTFADADDVVLFSEQLRQTLHQQQSFVVALHRRLSMVEHFIQCGSLHLRAQQDVNTTRREHTQTLCLTVTLLLLLTICTVWLNSSRSAVMELIWSMRRCFLEKKRSRRVLSERQDATLDLYSSLSLFTTDTKGKKEFVKRDASKKTGNLRKQTVPCLTVADGYSLPCLTRSIAVVNADDKSSALFR